MNQALRTNLCAYIQVLNVKEVVDQVPPTGLITGCLMRLDEALSKMTDQASQNLHKMIQQRESMNDGRDTPQFIRLTNDLAYACLRYYQAQQ